MKIALVGYGKMGKAVEQEAIARDHEISFRVDRDDVDAIMDSISDITPDNTDAIIEFTQPDAFKGHIQELVGTGVPVVSGTTGWHDSISLDEIKGWADTSKVAFLYASNFSIGVNVLFKLNQQLAKMMNRYPEYDCYIEEQHHRYKKDAPSGTALSLGNQVLEGLDRKTKIADAELRSRAPLAEELSVGFVRSGEIIGKHRVAYHSEIDEIRIEHQAFSRRGFALGAVIAAEWIVGKQGVFEFGELF